MKKLPPLVELRAFEAAARHLSFKKAADAVSLPGYRFYLVHPAGHSRENVIQGFRKWLLSVA
jgi:DNA-binding transcriptional LysR family regulator